MSTAKTRNKAGKRPAEETSAPGAAGYLLAGQASELERLQLQSRVWEPSGRRLLKEIVTRGEVGSDVTALEDHTVIDRLKAAVHAAASASR